LKILFLALDVSSRHGGIQRFNQRVVRVLDGLRADGGHAIRAISVRDTDHDIGGVHVDGSGGDKSGMFLRAGATILRWQPDVILLAHVLLTPLGVAARLLAPRARTLLFVHGYEVWDDPEMIVQPAWVHRATRRGVKRVISVSEHTAGRMRTAFALGDKPIDLLPNALDVEPSSGAPTDALDGGAPPQRSPSPPPREPRQILTVSRLDEWGKGVDRVIRALPRVIERVGPVMYVVAGDGKLRPDHERVAAEAGVTQYVRFAGRVSDAELDRLYRTSAVFALPSMKEGFGIVYLEAWKNGLPVLAGNRDAAREVVDDGVNGLVVDPLDINAIADALARLLSDPAAAARMAIAGREKLDREYSHNRFDERLRAILLNVR
jgi:phosphatidylinositol alpha-1,6-mannosyltransferase